MIQVSSSTTSAQDMERFMREALREAQKAQARKEVPVGAVVVEGETIVGRAHNMVETLHDPTAHAEMIAITQAAEHRGDWRLEGMTIFVTLEPCAMCAGAMVLARFDRLVYGAGDPRAGACGSVVDVFRVLPQVSKVEVVGGILKDECGSVLRAFFKESRDRDAESH